MVAAFLFDFFAGELEGAEREHVETLIQAGRLGVDIDGDN